MIRSRAFAGPSDLSLLTRAVRDAWREHGPRVECTPGDLAWRYNRNESVNATENVRLWERGDGSVAGFAWFYPNGDLDLLVHPRELAHRLVPEMLAWAESRADEPGALNTPTAVLTAWALESNRALREAILARGYTPLESGYVHLHQSLDATPATPPALPPGYTARAVSGHDEIPARSEVHRAAFGSQRFTERACRAVMDSSEYRRELDTVIVAPDGRLASFALAWFDEANLAGEFEPVGTRPEEQRKGLARAAIVHGLATLRAMGARGASIYAQESNPKSVGLYTSLGFARVDRNCGFTRPQGSPRA